MADFNSTYFESGDLYGGIPSPALATYFAPSFVSIDNNTIYYQRVYDTVNGWCYYSTYNVINPNPAPTDTSPNWSGVISNPQVISSVPVTITPGS
jgi:hypothetical protein